MEIKSKQSFNVYSVFLTDKEYALLGDNGEHCPPSHLDVFIEYGNKAMDFLMLTWHRKKEMAFKCQEKDFAKIKAKIEEVFKLAIEDPEENTLEMFP